MKYEKTEYCLPICPDGARTGQSGCRQYEVVADSFKGLVRKRNEDSFAFAWDASETNLLTVVADGIGSTWNGDIAGDYAVRMLVQAWREKQFPEQMGPEAVRDFLSDCFCEINHRFFEINQLPIPEYNRDSLGTTLTAAVFMNGTAVAVNAGDSPLFRIRDAQVKKITFDHSLANELLRIGQISPDEVNSLAYGRRLTRFIGPKEVVEPECYAFDVRRGDYFLICSDGLTLHLTPDEISRMIISSESDLSQALKKLFRRTMLRGAKDNVTAILVKSL